MIELARLREQLQDRLSKELGEEQGSNNIIEATEQVSTRCETRESETLSCNPNQGWCLDFLTMFVNGVLHLQKDGEMPQAASATLKEFLRQISKVVEELNEDRANLAQVDTHVRERLSAVETTGHDLLEGLRARVACVEAEKESIEKEQAEVRVALCKEKEELVTDLEQSERQREIAEQKFDKCKALLQVRGLCFCLWGCVIL